VRKLIFPMEFLKTDNYYNMSKAIQLKSLKSAFATVSLLGTEAIGAVVLPWPSDSQGVNFLPYPPSRCKKKYLSDLNVPCFKSSSVLLFAFDEAFSIISFR
jgi:hypothetical protein